MKLDLWKALLRFRLRTLLIIITAAAVWLAFYAHSARVQQKSVEAIRKYGGWVRYDFQFPSGDYDWDHYDGEAQSWVPRWCLNHFGIDFFHSVVQVNLNYSEDSGKREENGNQSDVALQYLRGLPNLRVLLLSDTQASDAAMKHLANLPRLDRLMMWDVVNVTDNGVENLKKLNNLRYIHLTSSRITDKSLELFSQLRRIEGLSLQFNRFTDEGVRHIAKAHQLQELWLCGKAARPNKITDAGLKLLHELPKLKELGIQSTQVTPAGLDALGKALPGCQVYHH